MERSTLSFDIFNETNFSQPQLGKKFILSDFESSFDIGQK